MKIAINNRDFIKKLNKNDIIYVFDKENLDSLLKLGVKCINYKYIDEIENIDINTTNYDIDCIAKCDINEIDNIKLPKHKDYFFSIIIPNYNNDHGEYKGKTFLRNCIESVLNQTYTNFELIIIDDMSTDTSVQTIKSYKDERIKLIQNNRKRYNGGSRNVGIDIAKGDYICFLDSDDWWVNNKVLELINSRLYNNELMLIGVELLNSSGIFMKKINEYSNSSDFFLSDNKVWCTAWCRVIRRDKIVYFCEDTLMEDRVWSYRQADNVDFNNIKNLKKVCYCWNRLNTTNSVSLVRNNTWNASAYCHIGHQLMLLEQLRNIDYKNLLKPRIEKCKEQVNNRIYQQF